MHKFSIKFKQNIGFEQISLNFKSFFQTFFTIESSFINIRRGWLVVFSIGISIFYQVYDNVFKFQRMNFHKTLVRSPITAERAYHFVSSIVGFLIQ